MEPTFTKTLAVREDVESLVLISDIHGVLESLLALETVIHGLEADGPVQVVVLGDIAPGGVNPLETLGWVREQAGEFALLGNHDIKALRSPDSPAHLCTEQGVRHRLDAEQFQYLAELPLVLDLTWRSHSILCTHGHVSPENVPLTNTALPGELLEKLARTGADLVATGHTHFPFVLRRDGCIVANTGSTSRLMYGVSSKGGPVMSLERPGVYAGGKSVYSSCLVARSVDGRLDVSVRAFDYDRPGYVEKLRAAGDPWFDINRIIFETGVAYW